MNEAPIDFAIRDATAADLDGLTAIARSRTQHADRLRDADGECLRYFVAVLDGQLIGFGLLVFSQPPTWPPQRPMPRMIDLFVAPEHRRKGIATAMIGHMEEIARQRGHQELLLSVEPERNASAMQLYLHLGYLPVQERPFLDQWRYVDSAGGVHEGQAMLIDLRKEL